MEMRINTGDLNARAVGIHRLDLCVLIGQEAIPSHAGVNFDMCARLCAAALCDLVQAVCRLRRTDGGDGIRLHRLIRLICHGG